MAKSIQPNHFAVVATTEGLWQSSTTLRLALERLRKQIPARKGKPAPPITVFASTAPISLEFDVYVRAYSEEGHPLIQFEI